MDGYRIAIAALLLAGCAHKPSLEIAPAEGIVQSPPPSALKMYEAGRKDALDELRRHEIWDKPIYTCADKVSWVDPNLATPSWESRTENLRLLDKCRKNAIYNGGLAEEQRAAVKQAR